MPSKNMLPKGERRKSVKAEYRVQRTLAQERAAALRESGEAADKVAAPRSHSTAPL
jgi:23S rRNA pseudouridine1911/1915/1917 synthase